MLQALRAAQCTNLYTVRVYLFPLSFEVAAAAAEERGEGGGRRHMTNMVTYAPPPPPRSRETSEGGLSALSQPENSGRFVRRRCREGNYTEAHDFLVFLFQKNENTDNEKGFLSMQTVCMSYCWDFRKQSKSQFGKKELLYILYNKNLKNANAESRRCTRKEKI